MELIIDYTLDGYNWIFILDLSALWGSFNVSFRPESIRALKLEVQTRPRDDGPRVTLAWNSYWS